MSKRTVGCVDGWPKASSSACWLFPMRSERVDIGCSDAWDVGATGGAGVTRRAKCCSSAQQQEKCRMPAGPIWPDGVGSNKQDGRVAQGTKEW